MGAREAIRAMPASKIREVANAAMGNPAVLPFWFGEPDAVTPAFIREAAKQALDDGDTFYHHNLGLPALRSALAVYASDLHHTAIKTERVAVTSSGVSALMLAAQALLGPGDEVVVVVPLWPNITEIPVILGAKVRRVALSLSADGQWQLDLARLLEAITPTTRLLIVNSPNNPTGWTMGAGERDAILARTRHTGTWILSDEAYERLVFNGQRSAASFLDVAAPDDRLVVANTFSKTWQMTGWRLGWLVAPEALMHDLGKLIEFNTSCAPGFVQRAGVVAVQRGEASVNQFVQELCVRRDALTKALRSLPGVKVSQPAGAMYLWLQVQGQPQSLPLAHALVREAQLGLAPGLAFGPEGEGGLRWCFAKAVPQLEEGARRLQRWLEGAKPSRA
jgi:aspartate/methionine/tyrosine aminotransferase